MNWFRQIFAWFTVLLVLIGTTGPSVYQHYCSLFGQTKFQILHVDACCSLDYCHDDGTKESVNQTPCCSVVEFSLKSDFNTPLESELKLKELLPLSNDKDLLYKATFKPIEKTFVFASDVSPPHINGRFISLQNKNLLL
jgi:hypothetical protein